MPTQYCGSVLRYVILDFLSLDSGYGGKLILGWGDGGERLAATMLIPWTNLYKILCLAKPEDFVRRSAEYFVFEMTLPGVTRHPADTALHTNWTSSSSPS